LSAAAPRARGLGRWLAVLPLLVFGGLAALFLLRLDAGPSSLLPSALIGRPVPVFSLPPIPGVGAPGLAGTDLGGGRVSIVNVWASWCGPCREEHPLLMALARSGEAELVGIANKDDPEHSRRFLAELGNPFSRVGTDRNGRVSIDWGVYGVPETFVVDAAGRIAFKHVGPLTDQIVRDRLLPAVRAARAP
jgi:cytochrome c biogenesis protein CcmG/thiol:disulfide interchange protein DsbE